MSILDTSLQQAKALGIDPTAVIDKPGMVLVLQKADSLNLLSFKAGMEQAWLDTALLWARKHRQRLTLQDLLAGLLHLASEPRSGKWLQPIELLTSIEAYYSQNYRQALGARLTPELPPELELAEDTAVEAHYLNVWKQAARLTGDYESATRQARLAINLPAEPPKLEAGGYELTQLTKGLLK